MGISYQGDPASALLEVLDPEQNTAFRDTYLDIPFDVSQVLFIVTANTLETIPRPLLDRMEIITLSGYTSDEKLAIGRKYLVPKSLEKHGLQKGEITYSAAILRKIANEYAREAGVRNFEKSLDRINRKVALKIVENPELETPVVIKESELTEYLGQPIFVEDEILKADKPGMAIGLAWTSMGGDTLIIEAQNTPGKGEIKLTGQLGDVMQESVSIAHTYIKAHADQFKIDPAWFEHNGVHLHVPEGATPKDGPSAGITMTVALYSLVTNQVMAPNLAMTGELTLKGKVMPIGGLKEKILAAKRNKIKEIIIPQFNKRDLDELEDEVKKNVTFHPVGTIEEVLALAFPKDKDRKLIPFHQSEEEQSSKNEEMVSLAQAVASAVKEALS
jgi:ATP-dependent Lon protease